MKRLTILVATLAVLCSCGSSLPDDPKGTVEETAKALSKNDPEILWEALPESYQNDVKGLITDIAKQIEPNKAIYNDGMKLLSKAADVLREKKDFITKTPHPMLSMMIAEPESFASNFDATVGLIDTILKSDIASYDSFKSMDPGDFLSDTGGALMEKIAAVSKLSKDDGWENDVMKHIKNLIVEFLSEGDAGTKLKMINAVVEAEEMLFVKVEDKWLPKEMVDDWKKGIDEAKAQINSTVGEKASAEDVEQAKQMIQMFNQSLDELSATKTPEQFNAKLGQILSQMMG